MNHGQKKLSMKNRRAVSQIIGSLIVLAVVASVGSVILFQGLNQINAFNYSLTFDRVNSETLREDILFEHVRFDPNTDAISLYLANIGSIDSNIATLTVVKIDTQELLLAWSDVDSIDGSIPIEDHTVIITNVTLPGTNMWNQTNYNSTDYKISITTSKGNFFDTVATPYDT